MNSLEHRESRRLVTQALPDRLSGSIRIDHKPAIAMGLLDHIEALDIAT